MDKNGYKDGFFSDSKSDTSFYSFMKAVLSKKVKERDLYALKLAQKDLGYTMMTKKKRTA